MGHADSGREIKVFAKVFFWVRYNLVLLVSTYIIPLGCMALCYARMGANLWGTEMVGEETPALMKSRQSKQKVPVEISLTFFKMKVPETFL